MSKTTTIIAKHFESIHDGDLTTIGLQPKMDCSGNWTEGYGKLMIVDTVILKGEKFKSVAYENITLHTEEEALKDLENRYDANEKYVRSKLTRTYNQNMIDALCLHYDNCGYSTSLFQLANKGMMDELKQFWLHNYIKSGGVILNGLIKRRACEYHLAMTGEINYEAYKIYNITLQ